MLKQRSERYGECILPGVEFGTMEVKEWSFILLLLVILELIVVVHSDGLNLEKWFPRRSLHRMHVLQKKEHDSQWEGHQSAFQAPRDRFGTAGCLISKQLASVGLGQQQKENIG